MRNFESRAALMAAIFVLMVCEAFPQDDYYRFPMDVPPLLSANFAEMRTNHFHSGIDIKTGGTVGHDVYAVADGYISRVSVTPGGYGRALYIAHPNGTTSVYGHLQSFSPQVEKYLKEQRYKQQKSNITLFFTSEQFPVRRGDVVAVSGNSGYSLGPHLHFEIRNTADSRTLNTLARGFVKVRDRIAPTISALYYVRVDTVSGVPLHGVPRKIELTSSGNVYTSSSAVEVSGCGYFIIETTDRKNDVNNTFGVYRIVESLDEEPVVVFEKDEFLFSNTRYCNACVNFSAQKRSRNEHIMLALKQNNMNPMYKSVVNRGVVCASEGQSRRVRILVEDDCGNSASLDFEIRGVGNSSPVQSADASGRKVGCDSKFSYSSDGLMITIPAGSLYEPMFYRQSVIAPSLVARPDNIAPLSKIYAVADSDVPLHKAFSMAIAVSLPETLASKACFASVSEKGTLSCAGGKYRNGLVEGSLSSFGRYCVVADTVAPVVTPSFKDGDDLGGRRSVTFTMRDNFSGIADFQCSVDGKWAILEQDVIKGTATLFFDSDRMDAGRNHTLTFTAVDGVGNKTVIVRKFLR